jgi:hypothetical protein
MAWESPWSQRRQGPPRINLLPKAIHEQRAIRRQRGEIAAAFVLLVLFLGFWYLLEQRQLAEAEREADREQATAASLRTRRAELQPLADLEAQIAAAEQLRAQVYAHEIRFSAVMQDISAIVPDDVWLTSMDAAVQASGPEGAAGAPPPAQAGANASTATPGSPGSGSPVAAITFGGAGLGHIDVGGFLRALARGPKKDGQPVYLNPYFSTSQKGDTSGQQTVTFSATVDLSAAAYSDRYQPDASGTVTP